MGRNWRAGLVLPHCAPDPLLPLGPVLQRALAPTINRHYTTACTALTALFRDQLQLEAVLRRARQVYFMEAGDLMLQFCSTLFTRLAAGETGEKEGSASLTLALQDCLAERFPDWSDQWGVTCTGPGMACLSLTLATPWPLSLVLSPATLNTYNAVFRFLASVKRSLWALQAVRPAALAELQSQVEAKPPFALSPASVSGPAPCSAHRLQLLRSWLLHFSTTLHGYFMSRVVHTTELQLAAGLLTATDLDQLLEHHQTYLTTIHDRCFLHPGVSMVRAAVERVLGLGLELQQAVTTGLPLSETVVAGWEERYSRCHQFLANTLQSITAKRSVPHLEGLAAALHHSCPAPS